jgi:hypothetical protein
MMTKAIAQQLRFNKRLERRGLMSTLISSAAVDDTECIEEALREYRESSWDDRDFRDMPAGVRHVILQQAQDIKDRESRLHASHVINITETHP